jgi:pimeloyl-ACP methyl ester carboxylesterase
MGITLDENDPEAGLQFITELARQQISNPERAEQLQQVFMRTRSRLVGSRQAKRWLKLLETTSAYGEVTRDPLISIDDLARLAPPVLAIFGEYSMSIASGETLARHCADCTFEIVPKAGHFFPLTRPQVFAQRSLHFLARHTDDAQLQAKVQRRERAVVRRRAFRRLRQGPAEPPQ